ncbi:restriction endonuclease subunit S [Clostridium sp. KNHs216]|uniref:restriction endonuclease subunit S n=1 Tax=Clostridium sp. KNHs216 TaxID=1550235 RepID=UPI0011516C14|nr:restriction endonuclease subunit S [Clostridium sp. KNHs216]TQI69025.1 type I restriction modification DNA specificity protein [Clostridium sp. KNHs216]
MSKIDTSNWEHFPISLFFNIAKGTRLTKADMKEGTIRFIGASSVNNGITAYISNDEHLHSKNTITVTYNGSIGEAFYQDERFWASDDVNILYPKFQMNKSIAMFFIPLIKKVGKQYAFIDKWKKEDMENEFIKVPVDLTGNPDFAYMESYMQNLETEVSASLIKLQSARQSRNSNIDISKWKLFHLYDIFEIDSGTKLDKVKMDTSLIEIDFVGRSNFNNGITEKVKKIDGLVPYEPGNLTLALGGAYLGACFVQENQFYTSQNVVVLIPKVKISFWAKQFIATAIFKESQNNYQAFIKELNAHIKRDFSIKLPATPEGMPDYDYMATYMKKMESKAEHTLNSLKTL